jgi:hypothetical protein
MDNARAGIEGVRYSVSTEYVKKGFKGYMVKSV